MEVITIKHSHFNIICGNGENKNHCWLSSLLVWCCVLLLTPRLELGGLVGGGTFLVRFGGGLDGVSRQSLPGTACHRACRRTCGPSSFLPHGRNPARGCSSHFSLRGRLAAPLLSPSHPFPRVQVSRGCAHVGRSLVLCFVPSTRG